MVLLDSRRDDLMKHSIVDSILCRSILNVAVRCSRRNPFSAGAAALTNSPKQDQLYPRLLSRHDCYKLVALTPESGAFRRGKEQEKQNWRRPRRKTATGKRIGKEASSIFTPNLREKSFRSLTS